MMILSGASVGCCHVFDATCALERKPTQPTPPVVSSYLNTEPDTLWLVQPNATQSVRIQLLGSGTRRNWALGTRHVPTGVSLSFTPSQLGGANDTSSLAVSVGSSFSGVSTIQLIGVHQADTAFGSFVLTTVKPFTLWMPNAGVTVEAGQTVSVVVGILRTSGFAGDVQLSARSQFPGITPTVTSPLQNTNATAVVAASGGLAPNQYEFTVVGTYKNFADTLVVPIRVTAQQVPDFGLAVTPNALTVTRGAAVNATLSVTRAAPQVGIIQLQEFGKPAAINVRYAPDATSSASSTVTFDVPATVPAGTYAFDIAGLWQGLTRRTRLTLTVEDPSYTLTPTPADLTIPRGGALGLALRIDHKSPVLQAVNLTKHNEPAGITATFPNNASSYAESGSATNITVTVDTSVVPGTYKFQLLGEALGVQRSAEVTVLVTQRPIGISLNPASLSVQAGGASNQMLLAISGLGYQQSATVRLPGSLPAGVVGTVTPAPNSLGSYIIDFVALPGAKGGTFSIPVQVIVAGVTYTVHLSLTITGV